MKTKQINIAIAEACGWHVHYMGKVPYVSRSKVPDWEKRAFRTEPLIPDYCNDLNAMASAEKTLRREQVYIYQDELRRVMEQGNRVTDCGPFPSDFIWHATAAQRAEAFLKTLGLWQPTTASPTPI